MADIYINATKSNTCPICFEGNLYWHPNPVKSSVEVFQCRHFTCKQCYHSIMNDFKCPCCRSESISVKYGFINTQIEKNKWNTLSDWINEFSIYFSTSQNWDRWVFGKIYLDMINEKKKNKLGQNKIVEKKSKSGVVICSCGKSCNSNSQLLKHKIAKNCK